MRRPRLESPAPAPRGRGRRPVAGGRSREPRASLSAGGLGASAAAARRGSRRRGSRASASPRPCARRVGGVRAEPGRPLTSVGAAALRGGPRTSPARDSRQAACATRGRGCPPRGGRRPFPRSASVAARPLRGPVRGAPAARHGDCRAEARLAPPVKRATPARGVPEGLPVPGKGSPGAPRVRGARSTLVATRAS